AKFAESTEDGAQAPKTATGVCMGTAEYMAPEMLRGEPPDVRVDIYALGVLLYKLLTGVTPYQGNHVDIAVEQTRRDAFAPSRAAPMQEIPPVVDALVLRALAKDLRARIPTMTALREAIATALTSTSQRGSRADTEGDSIATVVRSV